MSDRTFERIKIVALSHDLVRKRTIVTLVWTADPEKSVALPVRFGCGLDDIELEAQNALQAFAEETSGLRVEL